MSRLAHPCLGMLSLFLLLTGNVRGDLPAPAAKPTAVDNLGDPLPAHALARMGTLRWRQEGYVHYVGFLPDGKQLLTAAKDGMIRVWDTDSGRELRCFGKAPQGNSGYGTVSLLTTDGRYFANAGGRELVTRCWEVSTGKELWELRQQANQGGLWPMAFSPDGQTLAHRGADWTIVLRQTASGKEVCKLQGDAKNKLMAIAFAPDGRTAATCGTTGVVRLWDAATGKELRQFDPQVKGYGNSPPGFTRDGKTLRAITVVAQGQTNTGTVTAWDVASGKQLYQLKGPDNTRNDELLFSADDQFLVWRCTDGKVRVQELAPDKEPQLLGEPVGERAFLAGLVFSPDSKLLAAHSGTHTHVWDVAARKELRRDPGYPGATAFSPDSKTLATSRSAGGPMLVQLADIATGKDLVTGHRSAVGFLALSADGQTLTTLADRYLRSWETGTGKLTSQVALPPVTGPHSVLSPDGRTLATGTMVANQVARVQLWDTQTARPTREIELPQPGLSSLTFSPDGKTLAVRAGDRKLRFFDVADGKEKGLLADPFSREGAPGARFYPAGLLSQGIYSADGSLLATRWTGTPEAGRQRPEVALIGNVATGRTLSRLDMPGNMTLAAAIFSENGRTLLVANRPAPNQPPGGFITFWETASGKERFRFKGEATVLALAPDGRTLAGAGVDATIRFWDVRTGKELGVLTGHQNTVGCLAFTPDGRRLISGSADTTALVWDLSHLARPTPPPLVAALDARQCDALWAELAGDDAVKAAGAVATFSAAPGPAVAWLRGRLRAAEGVAEKRLAQLLAELDDPKFAVRQQATEELAQLGELAEPALNRVLSAGPPLETRQRIEQLLEKLANIEPPPSGVLQVLRAIEVLEAINTPEARQLLATLAGGAPGARVTREARVTLDRLDRAAKR